jgi:NhaP-type Na+/H+ or K+/H+ antiporter
MTLLSIFIALIFLYSLFSALLEKTVLTAPILFTTAGIIVSQFLPELLKGASNQAAVRHLAEVGLVMLLFTDASRTNFRMIKRIGNLPVRLLSTGMLLTILFGAIAALVVFRQLSIWEAGILGAILAPTDAGLGQVIVNSPRVPVRIRQALNVEAGLNDGLSVPFMMFFIALAGAGGEGHRASLAGFMVEQLGYGAAIGAGVGGVGGWLLGVAHRRRWIAEAFNQLGLVVLPLLCLFASEAVGASMFIAAFVAGLAVQVGFKEAGKHSVEFTEEWGQLLNLLVFLLFGLLVARDWRQITAPLVLYAVLSLTVVRIVPVAIALIGTRLSRATVLFMGWFGPRGLASIVLGLVYLEEVAHEPHEPTIQLAIIVTVLLSIFAHGLSAMPGISLYAASVEALDANAPERQAVVAPETKLVRG